MALIPEPTKIPRWNDTGGNRTEPPETGSQSKDVGWAVDDEPPSSYFNWLQHYTGQWIKWLNERMYKGTNEQDLTINSLTSDDGTTGGNLIITAGDGTTGNGGDLSMTAGDATTSGVGGEFTLSTGDSQSGNAGSVTINAGESTGFGDGGSFNLTLGDGAVNGGGFNVTAGSSTISGSGGDITLTAGDSIGNQGGDVTIDAGSVSSGTSDGGDITIRGGDALGTDQPSGNVAIETGQGTGSGTSSIIFKISEAGTSGSSLNALQSYLSLQGGAGNKRLLSHKYHRFAATETDRGQIQIVPKAQPTSHSLDGDVYIDSATEQARWYDNGNSVYRNMNPIFYVLPAATFSRDDTVQVRVFQVAGPTNFAVTVPANYIGVGTVIRVKAAFNRVGTFADEPGYRIYFGSVGSIGTSTLVWERAAFTGSSLQKYTTMVCECHVTTAGATGQVYAQNTNFANTAFSVNENGWQENKPVASFGSIDFTSSLDIFPTTNWWAVGAGSQTCNCEYFTVEIL